MPIKPTVIAINETFLKSNEWGPHCNLEGYKFESNCRNKYSCGGVGLYIRKGVSYEVLNEFTYMEEKLFESIFIEITTSKKN